MGGVWATPRGSRTTHLWTSSRVTQWDLPALLCLEPPPILVVTVLRYPPVVGSELPDCQWLALASRPRGAAPRSPLRNHTNLGPGGQLYTLFWEHNAISTLRHQRQRRRRVHGKLRGRHECSACVLQLFAYQGRLGSCGVCNLWNKVVLCSPTTTQRWRQMWRIAVPDDASFVGGRGMGMCCALLGEIPLAWASSRVSRSAPS